MSQQFVIILILATLPSANTDTDKFLASRVTVEDGSQCLVTEKAQQIYNSEVKGSKKSPFNRSSFSTFSTHSLALVQVTGPTLDRQTASHGVQWRDVAFATLGTAGCSLWL